MVSRQNGLKTFFILPASGLEATFIAVLGNILTPFDAHVISAFF
jgi:hypothetical protein